jgi:hypothetical protein
MDTKSILKMRELQAQRERERIRDSGAEQARRRALGMPVPGASQARQDEYGQPVFSAAAARDRMIRQTRG